MLSWLVDKPANIGKSKQMALVNTIPHEWVQIYPYCTFPQCVWHPPRCRRPTSNAAKSINSLTERALDGKSQPSPSPTKVSQVIIRKSFDKCAPGPRRPSSAPLRRDSLPSLPADISTWQRCWISLFFIWPGPHGSIRRACSRLTGALSVNVFTI